MKEKYGESRLGGGNMSGIVNYIKSMDDADLLRIVKRVCDSIINIKKYDPADLKIKRKNVGEYVASDRSDLIRAALKSMKNGGFILEKVDWPGAQVKINPACREKSVYKEICPVKLSGLGKSYASVIKKIRTKSDDDAETARTLLRYWKESKKIKWGEGNISYAMAYLLYIMIIAETARGKCAPLLTMVELANIRRSKKKCGPEDRNFGNFEKNYVPAWRSGESADSRGGAWFLKNVGGVAVMDGGSGAEMLSVSSASVKAYLVYWYRKWGGEMHLGICNDSEKQKEIYEKEIIRLLKTKLGKYLGGGRW